MPIIKERSGSVLDCLTFFTLVWWIRILQFLWHNLVLSLPCLIQKCLVPKIFVFECGCNFIDSNRVWSVIVYIAIYHLMFIAKFFIWNFFKTFLKVILFWEISIQRNMPLTYIGTTIIVMSEFNKFCKFFSEMY